MSLPTSTRSPVAVWQTVFGFFFLDKTLTCPLSSVARETTWYELPESKSQKILSPRLNEGRCNHRHCKVRSLKERSDALLCTLPNIALRSGLAAWRLWHCLGGCRGTPRSGAPRASGSACGYCGVGFVRRHRSCLSQPAVAGPMPFLATVVAHVSLLGLALGTRRGTLSRLVLLVPLVGFVSSFTFKLCLFLCLLSPFLCLLCPSSLCRLFLCHSCRPFRHRTR